MRCMIDVRRLRVLRELADHGTVAAAAAALHLTPSAVSQQLAALTRETGVQLVEPDGRRLRLTDAALVLLGHAHVVFAQLEQAEVDLARHAEGHVTTIRIGAFPTALAGLVAPVTSALRGEQPPVTVHAIEADERSCFAQLAAGQLDVAISVELPGAPQQDGPRFHRQPLLTDVLDAALPAQHPLAGEQAIALSQLAGADWVIGRPGTSCHDVVMVACATAGFTPRAVHHTSDWASVAALVREGDSVALIPRLAQTLVPTGVFLVPLHGSTAARHVFAATRRGNHTAPTTQRALQHLTVAATAAAAVSPAGP
jgi:DNA-binding transcriptional LysR family regulator